MREQFLVPFCSIPGGRTLDYERIVKLLDDAFKQLYLEEMATYQRWWDKGIAVKCGVCQDVIESTNDLRRYIGKTLDAKCFPEYYRKHGDEKGVMRQYWERVAKIQ